MSSMQRIIIGLAALAVGASAAHAQFEGPAPLAWRWAQPTSVAPGGSPQVSGDRVYVAVGGRIYCLDRLSGNQIWRFPSGEPIAGNFRTGAVLVDGTVFASADNRTVYAVDAANGQLKWNHVSTDPLAGAPVVAGTYVVSEAGNDGLIALNAADGTPAWTEPYRVPNGILGSIGAHARNVLIFTQDYKLMALDAATRRPAWEAQFSVLEPNLTPVVFGDLVFVNTSTFLTAINAATGRARWQRDMGDSLVSNPAVSATGVMVVSREGRFYTTDTNGRPVISRGQDLQSIVVAPPAPVGKLMAAVTANGSLNLIDPITGDVKWNFIVRPMQRPGAGSDGRTPPNYVLASSSPVLAGETLLLQATDGSLLAFDRTAGVDRTPPTVEMLFPNAGDQVSGQPPLQLIFRIEDPTSGLNIDKVSVAINGQKVAHEITRDGILTVRFNAVGGNRPMTDGRKSIEVTAVDWMGNERKMTFSLTVDNTLRPIALPGGSSGGGSTGGSGGG